MLYSFGLVGICYYSNGVLLLSKMKDNLFQVAAGLLEDRRQLALERSSRENLRILAIYKEDRDKANKEYIARLHNVDGENAIKIFKTNIQAIKCKREILEEAIFNEYIFTLDWAEKEFAKESKALDNFVTFDDELSIEGE